MKIRYTDRAMIQRFGLDLYEVSDTAGANLMRQGKAIPVTSFDNPLVDKNLREKEKRERPESRKLVGKRPLVGWVQDTEVYGGAELSNEVVKRAGREFGYLFQTFTPSNFDKKALIACDFLVINNFFFFKPDQFHFILDLIFEYKKPYVKYEHDHREIIGADSRIKLARLLFKHSFLNVFISPFQERNHREKLGDGIDPYYLLPPAIDTRKFRILEGIERDPKLVVNTCGRLYAQKGYYNVLQFIMGKKKLKFEIYTREHQNIADAMKQLDNVKVFPLVENEQLPEIYNRATYTMHLPRAYEACGRTIAEGLLCGCKPIMNENMGIKSFKVFHIEDEEWSRDKFRYFIEQGPYSFWKAIWYYYHGLDRLV